MDQVQLLWIAERINPGQAYNISADDMREAAQGEFSSLLFDHVRDNDIIQFAAKIEKNWGVTMRRNIDSFWTMTKNIL